MSAVSGHKNIKNRLNTQWGASTPVAWPNVAFKPVTDQAWIRLTIKDGPCHRVELGAGQIHERGGGTIYVQVFVPEGKGTSPALTLADQIAAIFREWTYDNIACRTPSIRDFGSDGNGWYQVNVETPFIRDEII